MTADLHNLTATQAVRRIHEGTLRPEDLMEAYIERIAERDPNVRAFAHFDPDQARANAAAARPGPLQGLPIGVKDVLDTADMPSQVPARLSGMAGNPAPTPPPWPGQSRPAPW